MTGPQLENGYTRIANELHDAILATDFTKREMRVVLAVIRKTYGYGKKSDDMTISQLSYMTGISRSNTSRTYHGLVARQVLKSAPGVFGYQTSINKRHWEWDDRANAVPRRDVMERDGWRCRDCGRDTPIEMSGLYVDSAPEVDRAMEISAGGENDGSDLQLLCRKCHQAKTKLYLSGHASEPNRTRQRVERDTVAYQEGHASVSAGVRERAGGDTKEYIDACRKGHGERVERDTGSVSKGTHTKDNSKRQLQKTTPKDSCAGG